MATRLQKVAKDRSTFIVTVAFYESETNGDPVTPTAVTWTLTDREKNIINAREDVSVASPAQSVDIVLYGDDIDHDDGAWRRLVITATYDSDAGIGLPSRDVCTFAIADID